jgi:1-acyl-sn-glycerol-3-phosphate acyltransferase
LHRAFPAAAQDYFCVSVPPILLNPGNILILFPDGPFKSGIGLLAAGTDLPIVPCHLAGTFAAWPKGRILLIPRCLRL